MSAQYLIHQSWKLPFVVGNSMLLSQLHCWVFSFGMGEVGCWVWGVWGFSTHQKNNVVSFGLNSFYSSHLVNTESVIRPNERIPNHPWNSPFFLPLHSHQDLFRREDPVKLLYIACGMLKGSNLVLAICFNQISCSHTVCIWYFKTFFLSTSFCVLTTIMKLAVATWMHWMKWRERGWPQNF